MKKRISDLMNAVRSADVELKMETVYPLYHPLPLTVSCIPMASQAEMGMPSPKAMPERAV